MLWHIVLLQYNMGSVASIIPSRKSSRINWEQDKIVDSFKSASGTWVCSYCRGSSCAKEEKAPSIISAFNISSSIINKPSPRYD